VIVLDVIAGVALVLGALLSLIAAIGNLRLPDVLSRMQAVTKPQGLGLLLMLLGAALRLRNGFDVTTLVLVAAFQLTTAPVAASLVGSAAYRRGKACRSAVAHDDLADERDAG
jgi:multicomponent Na+:H+ antiporter subunit G